jgi:ribose transport system ATP-binding protein
VLTTEESQTPRRFGEPANGARRGQALFEVSALPAFLFCAVVVVLIAITEPDTMSAFGIELLLTAAIPAVFAALAQCFIILAGDIDLGLGSAMGLANVVAATLLVSHLAEGVAALVGLIAAYAAIGW